MQDSHRSGKRTRSVTTGLPQAERLPLSDPMETSLPDDFVVPDLTKLFGKKPSEVAKESPAKKLKEALPPADPSISIPPISPAKADKVIAVKDFEDTFIFHRHLNEGSSGTVYRVSFKGQSEKGMYAFKLMRPGLYTERQLSLRARIYSLLQEKCHDGFPCFYGFYKGSYRGVLCYGFLLEEIRGTDLLEFAIESPPLSPKEIYTMFRHLTTLVYYLHSNNLAHRDIKLENIMISFSRRSPALEEKDPLGEIYTKITLIDVDDTCSTSIIPSEYSCYDRAGTLSYMSPELLKLRYIKPSDYGVLKPADIWALGITMYTLITKHSPWDPRTPETEAGYLQAHMRFLKGEAGVLAGFEGPDEFLHPILNSLLTPDYERRPTAREILTRLDEIAFRYA